MFLSEEDRGAGEPKERSETVASGEESDDYNAEGTF